MAITIVLSIFRILQGEHNQAFNYAPSDRRTGVARLLTKR